MKNLNLDSYSKWELNKNQNIFNNRIFRRQSFWGIDAPRDLNSFGIKNDNYLKKRQRFVSKKETIIIKYKCKTLVVAHDQNLRFQSPIA